MQKYFMKNLQVYIHRKVFLRNIFTKKQYFERTNILVEIVFLKF